MLCHPLKVDPSSDLGFRWREGWTGAAAALPVNEFLISSHIAPGAGATRMENGMVLPMTLNRFSEDFSSYAFSIAYEDVWRPELRRLTLIRLYAVIKRAREAGLRLAADPPLMVIKEVNGSHGADLVMSLFPRSKMIFLARDGRDVLDSLLDANKEGGWMTKGTVGAVPHSNEEERREFVRENSLGWAARTTVCNVAYERHDPELRRKIRYEDLLADTEANLTDLASWLELPGGPKRIENIVKAHSFERVPEDRRGPGKIRRTATPGRLARGPEPGGAGGRPGDHGQGPGRARLRDVSSDAASAYYATAGLPFDDKSSSRSSSGSGDPLGPAAPGSSRCSAIRSSRSAPSHWASRGPRASPARFRRSPWTSS